MKKTLKEKELSAEQYRVLKEGGTEPPFSHPYYDEKRAGVYECANCGASLFTSGTKYASGSGWPSFFQTFDPQAIREETDLKHGMVRTEILCAECNGHLGHVFPDGPEPTGLRYCVNGNALAFQPDEE